MCEQVTVRTDGCVSGFDEYMNLMLADAEESHSESQENNRVGSC